MLEPLGFRFAAASGRVQLGADPRKPRPATHACRSWSWTACAG
ncbi:MULTISPECIES: hypothetical protein [Glycomyces]